MTVSQLLRHAPEWLSRGACGGQSKLMYDESRPEMARAVCYGCPVLDDCRAWVTALSPDQDPGGVIAATTEKERAGLAGTKVCSSCGVEQVVTEYAVRNSRTGLRRATCKGCVHAQKCARQTTQRRVAA
ncbi:hypothetical protein Aph01nite_43320 [Acrocarpospora phusangensis]|uniref:4Fe-4S Wbl-type domain-containing protein n=1 Tax=Acrocarpospora phusangensis TaxID=1070424 RepID=A0A919QGY1_9ACTN|nr:WhiB family transcriptional regulator [Acrocarpospora phusangensis]GIH26022.1 hypothetical protein Aph01nite_43320 [Acrocarpospora phusangensis]